MEFHATPWLCKICLSANCYAANPEKRVEIFATFNKTEGKKIAVQKYIDYWNLQKNEKQVVHNSFENSCLLHGSAFVKVRSSLYAVAFYQKAGYKKTTGVRDFVGLKVQPLKKLL